MQELFISDFKMKCIEIINAVSATGEAVIVTRRGKPLAKIMPLSEPATRRKLGAMAGEVQVSGDIVNNGFADDWESLA